MTNMSRTFLNMSKMIEYHGYEKIGFLKFKIGESLILAAESGHLLAVNIQATRIKQNPALGWDARETCLKTV